MTVEEIRDELSNLTTWFDIDYTRKEQKYNRLIRMNDTEENWQTKLENLDKEAENKRARIQELEKMLEQE